MYAAACGNSRSGNDAQPAPVTTAADVTAPTTTAPETSDGVSEPEPETSDGGSEPEPVPADGGSEPEPSEPETVTTTEPVVVEPVDPYPHRDEFVSRAGVPGVTGDEIRVAVVGTRSNNPLGTCILDCFVTGIQSYFDYVNDAGGIYGRRLVIGEVLDDELGFNKDRALKIIADNRALVSFQATLLALGWGDLHDARVPTFAWNPVEGVNRDTIFGNFVIGCITCTSRGLPWLVSQAGGTRVAALGYGISANSKLCTSAFADSVRRYGADLGAEVVYFNDAIAFGLPNGIGPEVTQMVDAGVDFIVTCMDLNAMLTLAQELERQGVRGQIKMLHPNTYDRDFVASAGSLFDGDYVQVTFAAFEYEIDSGLRHAYDRWVPANGGPVAEQTMVGWINADLFVTGLLEAGPSFDRSSIIDSLNRITYDADGLINPIDWSRQHTEVIEGDPTHDYENECVSFVRMEDGAFVGFQPAPWMCWPNDTLEWIEPTPTDFTR
ncbi:MAG: ABC transporter substrate-binding protein [Acidimicrobiaceae bacterium]|nr:ABC transporter substrate-binding protein [Acidimicrobiaceae bacterium]